MPKEKVNYQEVYDIVSKETYDKRQLLPCYIKI